MSPVWLTVEIKIVSKRILNSETERVIWFIAINIKIKDKVYAPSIPEYVLLGLILVNLGPLKVLPKTYPPKSVNTHTIIINNVKIMSVDNS